MKKNALIKKISAAFLLGIFMLAITPKKAIHDLFVHHTDNVCKQTNDPSQQITKPVFSCACDNLVAESLFAPATAFIISIEPVYNSYYDAGCSKIIIDPVPFSSLRGPPLKFQS